MVVAAVVFVILFGNQDRIARPAAERHANDSLSSDREAQQIAEDAGLAVPTATILSSSLVDFVNDKGSRMQKVVVRWKNSGLTPIRAIDAQITHWDASGKLLGEYDYTIFATFDDEPGVAPGEINTTRGFVLPGFQGMPGYKESKSVEVTITGVHETSGL